MLILETLSILLNKRLTESFTILTIVCFSSLNIFELHPQLLELSDTFGFENSTRLWYN